MLNDMFYYKNKAGCLCSNILEIEVFLYIKFNNHLKYSSYKVNAEEFHYTLFIIIY